MSYHARGLAALSDLPKLWPFGTYDCSNTLAWIAAPALCWKRDTKGNVIGPTAWAQIKNFENPFSSSDIKAPAAIPMAYGTAALSPAEVEAQIDQALVGASEETKAAVLGAVQQRGSEIPDIENKGLDWKIWAAGGVLLFGLIVASVRR